jgi:hypothetical protein
MAMKLLASHDQFVADLPPDHEQDNFRLFHIVEDAEIAHAEFELGQGVRP